MKSLCIVLSIAFIISLTAGSEKKINSLQQAVSKYGERFDSEIIENFMHAAIYENKLDFTQTDEDNNNIFHWATWLQGQGLSFRGWASEVLSYARKKQMNVALLLNSPNANHFTPFHLASRNSQIALIKEMLENGAQVDALGSEYINPLEILFDCKVKDLFRQLYTIIFMFNQGAKVRSQFVSAAYLFMRKAQSEVENFYPFQLIWGDVLENDRKRKELIKERSDSINFVSLLVERENKGSYLHQLPMEVFGKAFTFVYNFYTNRFLCEYNPYLKK